MAMELERKVVSTKGYTPNKDTAAGMIPLGSEDGVGLVPKLQCGVTSPTSHISRCENKKSRSHDRVSYSETNNKQGGVKEKLKNVECTAN